MAQGAYSGTFTVIEDSSRHPEADEAASLVGETFERELTLSSDCDESENACTVSHEGLALYYPEYVEITWSLERFTDRWEATYEEAVVDDCVDEYENIVGTFDTDVTYEMTLSEPQSVNGTLVWTTLEVHFEEDAISTDTDQGCYTSRYVAEGTLQRSGP